jgi:hypothetical protein
MTRIFSALKALLSFIGRNAKWLGLALFGVVVAVVVAWLGSRPRPLTDAERAMLKGMPERLKRYREAYEKALADAIKPKPAAEVKSDFDSNFGGKP